VFFSYIKKKNNHIFKMSFETNEDILKFLREHKDLLGEFHYEAMMQTLDSVEHIIQNKIDGDLIEIGVYKGVMIVAMIAKLLQYGITDKVIHLYDTFSGMTEPSDIDIDPSNISAYSKMNEILCKSPLEEVTNNINLLPYPKDNIIYHVGDIRKCDLQTIPKEIAFLRLDTDFYDSTLFELRYFEPNVVNNGVITLDDYNWWNGCTQATNEYLETIAYKVNKNYLHPHGLWWQKCE